MAVTTCVYPGPGPGPADVSSLRQLGDGRQGRGRARPEQAARAQQQRPVGCDQGPCGDHCSYTQTPGADTVTSETQAPSQHYRQTPDRGNRLRLRDTGCVVTKEPPGVTRSEQSVTRR